MYVHIYCLEPECKHCKSVVCCVKLCYNEFFGLLKNNIDVLNTPLKDNKFLTNFQIHKIFFLVSFLYQVYVIERGFMPNKIIVYYTKSNDI